MAFTASITGTTVFLTEFPHSTLEDVRVVLESDAMQDILQMLSYEDGSEQIAELEQILVMFRRPQIVCFCKGASACLLPDPAFPFPFS